jgi:phage terminase large subunit-like protein
MGHTIMPMRRVIYNKITQLKKLANALREPERSAANSLIYHVNNSISAISYANPLPSEIENNMVFVMLVKEKMKNGIDIDNLTLAFFALMVQTKLAKIPNERHPNRLLAKG